MKKLFAICFLTFTVTQTLWALPTTSVGTAWDASPDSTVSGYKLYYSVTSGTYNATNSIDVGSVLTYKLTRSTLVPGTKLYFSVTAYTAAGLESDFSNEISILIPRPPITLRMTATNIAINSFQGANLLVESTKDLVQPWNQESTFIASADTINYPIDSSVGSKFYRVTYNSLPIAQAVAKVLKALPPLPGAPIAPSHLILKRKMKIYQHGAEALMWNH